MTNLERLTAGDYVGAFETISNRITDLQRRMLRAHYSAPGRALSARQLAAAVELAKFNAANLHYGVLGGHLWSALGRQPDSDNVRILVLLIRPGERENEEWLWVMRPQVAQALQQLGWVTTQSELMPPIANLFSEGGISLTTVSVYERNPQARASCIEHYGAICSVCGFDFGRTYGELGHGYIQVHHLTPLSSITQEHAVDPVHDLRPVCPNCHAMLHRHEPPLEISELKAIIAARRIVSTTSGTTFQPSAHR
jgi:predicted HNH restriction endonuclease